MRKDVTRRHSCGGMRMMKYGAKATHGKGMIPTWTPTDVTNAAVAMFLIKGMRVSNGPRIYEKAPGTGIA